MCSRQFKHFSNIFLQLILFPYVAETAPLNYLGPLWRSVTKKLAQSSPQSGQCSDSEDELGLFKFFQWFAILSRNRRFFCVTNLTAWRWLHSSHSIYLITFGILLRNQSKLYDFFGDPMIFSILKTIKILRIFFFTSFFSFYWYFIFWWSLSF